jgi:hypothetical protein
MPTQKSAVAVIAVGTPVSTEGIIATTPAASFNNPAGQGNLISGVLNLTAGTGTTAVVLRVRSGPLVTSPLVGVAETDTLAAGASANIAFEFVDPAALNVVNQQYVVTLQQTGGTGAGTVNYGTIGVQPITAAF